MRVNKLTGIILLLVMAAGLWGCKEKVVYQLEDAGEEAAVREGTSEEENETEPEQEKEAEPEEGTIVVHVCGAVVHPGVYELKAGSRAAQAVEAAGGLTEDAMEESLNQARLLSDGEQIRVFAAGEVQEGAVPAQEGEVSGGKVNINTADLEELTSLNGIGEAKAKAILACREERGGFEKIEDICEADGIGEKTFEKIKDSITVN